MIFKFDLAELPLLLLWDSQVHHAKDRQSDEGSDVWVFSFPSSNHVIYNAKYILEDIFWLETSERCSHSMLTHASLVGSLITEKSLFDNIDKTLFPQISKSFTRLKSAKGLFLDPHSQSTNGLLNTRRDSLNKAVSRLYSVQGQVYIESSRGSSLAEGQESDQVLIQGKEWFCAFLPYWEEKHT